MGYNGLPVFKTIRLDAGKPMLSSGFRTYPTSVGTTETRGYDADGSLESVANTTSGGTISEFAWTLNEDGAPSQIDTTRGTTTTHQALTYDAMGRVTKACYATTTCTSATNTISYTYDGDSNVTQQVRADSVPNYDPYGNPIITTDHAGSSPTTPLRYAAQYLDPETSQYQMRALAPPTARAARCCAGEHGRAQPA